MQRVAAYTRVSINEQTDGYGRDTQPTKIKQWADLNDAEVADWYADTASGGDTERPGLQSLPDLVREGEYDAVLVYKADWLSRSLKDLLTIIDDVLEPSGTAFISVTEQFDTSTPSGRLFLQMIGSFSEFERPLITERMRDDGETLQGIAETLNADGVQSGTANGTPQRCAISSTTTNATASCGTRSAARRWKSNLRFALNGEHGGA